MSSSESPGANLDPRFFSGYVPPDRHHIVADRAKKPGILAGPPLRSQQPLSTVGCGLSGLLLPQRSHDNNMFTILARRFVRRARRRQSFSLPPLTPSDILRSIMPPTVAGGSRGRALCTSSHWRLGRTRPHRPRSPALSRVSQVGRPEVGLLPSHLPGTGPPVARSPLLPPQGQRGRGRRGPHGGYLHGGF